MKVRWKIVAVVVPLLIVTISLVGVSAVLSSTTGITRLAQDFLDFKAGELQKHGESQWRLLVENDFTNRPEMISAMQGGMLAYAETLLSTETELVLAADQTGGIQLATADVSLSESERQRLARVFADRDTTLQTFALGGIDRVVKGFYFAPFDWFFLFTETRETFYRDTDRIVRESVIILVLALAASISLLLLFAGQLTRPMAAISRSMRTIIKSGDLTERVAVEYHDETGEMAHTFNIMLDELERAYTQIKKHAFQAVLAQKKETRIRNIFQKYVPQDLIDRFFENPEGMLVGENRELAILFSDIRSFTSISEAMKPDDLVSSLNRYFSVMVDIIMNRQGIIDKYIGDAIMAFFGAPVKHDGDALSSVLAGIEMTEAVQTFNRAQRESGRPEFHTGVGIAWGEVTVGNIGTEKKMDYTVIGDIVNLASRLEGLTKRYQQGLIIGDSLFPAVENELPWRLLDTVAVKGKSRGVRIYTAARDLETTIEQGWRLHNDTMETFYRRDFAGAIRGFEEVLHLLEDDPVATMMLERARNYRDSPPPDDWDGVEIMETK